MTVVGEGSDGATMARYKPHLSPNLRRDPRLERSPHRRHAPIYGVRGTVRSKRGQEDF